MNMEKQLKQMGLSDEQIASATINGKPLSEVEPKSKLPPNRKDLADDFCGLWNNLGPNVEYVREHRFHPPRKWRFDVAFLDAKVAVELEGGIWTRGRHVRPKGYKNDMEKYNAAQADGWVVLRFCANDIEQSPMQVIEQVSAVLGLA